MRLSDITQRRPLAQSPARHYLFSRLYPNFKRKELSRPNRQTLLNRGTRTTNR